jgi:type I restriction enzyme, R subunit
MVSQQVSEKRPTTDQKNTGLFRGNRPNAQMNVMEQPKSANFIFLAKRYPDLERIGAICEHYFTFDPIVALITLRQFGELLAQMVAARSGLLSDPREQQADILKRLRIEANYPREVLDLFHQIRIDGNAATHRRDGDHAKALACLKMARQLGIWFYRTFDDRNFKSGPFQPPRPPVDPTAELAAELDKLKAERDAALTEAQRAKAAAAEADATRLSAEEGAEGAAKERQLWEQLAAEAEAAKNELSHQLARLEAPTASAASMELREESTYFERRLHVGSTARESARELAEQLVEWQVAAEASPAAEKQKVLQLAEVAAEAIDLDEADTRVLIDEQLRERGWDADSLNQRYAKGSRPVRGKSMAIAEWPTSNGPADYALFIGMKCIAFVEAKRKRKNVQATIDQTGRYSQGFIATDGIELPEGGPWRSHSGPTDEPPFCVPFLFATNGRPYLKQVETQSGIWFRDARKPANHRRALVDWPTPEGLLGLLEIDAEAAQADLKARAIEFAFPLRPYQKRAIEAVETELATGRRAMLLAMATGTGKTKLAIALLYRLLAAKRFRRVCFVVDRSALGTQAAGEFATTRIVSAKTFADIFGLKGLDTATPDPETKVHICTIQGLVKRVLYTENASEAPPVDQYDLMIVDECHRGYLLDREMSDAELGFRSQEDYVSKYRRVLEYFDAVKVGLTATPALHTVDIFGNLIFTYSYREAVIDDFLVDHDPPLQITTGLSQAGITFKKGEEVELIDTKTGAVDLAHLPDDIQFEVENFNKKVVTVAFNRTVADELARHIDPNLPGKTLIFAANDAHTDIVVEQVKKAFGEAYGEIEDAAVRKITGSVDRVGDLIRSFRNDTMPKIAVTVDLLTTGIDVPKIENLVFLRRVNSRILYEQMLGRATRKCPEIGKETFRIFDAVDLYSHLQNLTAMKPVVIDPTISLEQLFKELAEVEDQAHREAIRDQIIVKMRRRVRRMPEEARARYEVDAGETPEATLERLTHESPASVAAWVKQRPTLGGILDWNSDSGTPLYIPISVRRQRS